MPKIKTLTRDNLDTLKARLTEAMLPIAEQYGVSVQFGHGSFSPSCFTGKIEIAVISDDGTVQSKEREDFHRYCFRYGLEPSDLDKQIRLYNGRQYTITGANPKNRKYPILLKCVDDGQRIKTTVSSVKVALRAAEHANA